MIILLFYQCLFCPILADFYEVFIYLFFNGALCFSKQISQLESEKRYLEKSNKHLENILEATNTYKKQEVSELNRIHVETIKVW